MKSSRCVRVGLLFALLLAATLSLAAPQPGSPASDDTQPAASASTPAPTLQTRDPRYHVNKNDQLSLNFVFTPEYDQTVTVQPDGFITARGVGDVHVEGMTLPEVSETLQKSYSAILHEPLITVLATNTVAAYFIVGGEVKNPGRYTFAGDTSVTQGIQIAGGFLPSSKHSEVVLFRRVNNDWVQARKVNVKEMLKTANLAEDLHLQPGDMLFVPKNTISKTQQWLLPFSDFLKFGIIGNFPVVF